MNEYFLYLNLLFILKKILSGFIHALREKNIPIPGSLILDKIYTRLTTLNIFHSEHEL